MHYIIVQPEGILSSAQRAALISRELYNITVPKSVRPEDYVSNSVFGSITHPVTGECALIVDLDYKIYVHAENNISDLVSLLPEVPQEEIESIATSIINSAGSYFLFRNIIPSTVTVRDYDYMVLNGWIEESA